VIEEQAIEEDLVGVLERAQVNMTLEVFVLSLVGLVCARCLAVETLDLRRQKSVQAQGGTFLIRERVPLFRPWRFRSSMPRETSACSVVISGPSSVSDSSRSSYVRMPSEPRT